MINVMNKTTYNERKYRGNKSQGMELLPHYKLGTGGVQGQVKGLAVNGYKSGE